LKHTIVAVNGDRDTAAVREFSENMLARDVKALREQINKVMPDVDMKVNAVKSNGDVVEGIDLPIGVSFFWPDSGV
jgi:tetrahydromethanopterin S-methyltransferase subunit B